MLQYSCANPLYPSRFSLVSGYAPSRLLKISIYGDKANQKIACNGSIPNITETICNSIGCQRRGTGTDYSSRSADSNRRLTTGPACFATSPNSQRRKPSLSLERG